MNTQLNIKLILLLFLAAGLMLSCTNEEEETTTVDETEAAETLVNTLTQEEIDEGWVLLFDGETTDGWRGYNQDSFPEEGWVIEDQTLKVTGGGGDIIYDQMFHNFHVKLEWKVSEAGNSGIFYLAQEVEDTPIWHSAPEMQILDNQAHPDADMGVNGNRQAGSLYDLIPADPQNFRGAGEWNEAGISVNNGTVTHYQNGVPVVEYELGTEEWDEMVANSKFEPLENFGIDQPGYFGLQDHGDDVWFRNIRILDND